MECGNCGYTEFEVASGQCYCTNCGACVDSEVAAALNAGFEPQEDNNGPS